MVDGDRPPNVVTAIFPASTSRKPYHRNDSRPLLAIDQLQARRKVPM
jgi:hypothetical protein